MSNYLINNSSNMFLIIIKWILILKLYHSFQPKMPLDKKVKLIKNKIYNKNIYKTNNNNNNNYKNNNHKNNNNIYNNNNNNNNFN